MTAKNRVTINLDDEEYRALQKIAEQTDRSLSWLGRKAVCEFINSDDEKAFASHGSKSINQGLPAQ